MKIAVADMTVLSLISLWYNRCVSALAIHTRDLTKRFVIQDSLKHRLRRPWARTGQEITAVDRVSLDVHEGELFGLLGPNGAGKTTLIKLLCTLVVPTSGVARIGGVDLEHAGRVRALVGMASGDERSFYWRLSGRDNLEFFAALYGLDPAAARRRVAQLLAQFELADRADQPFRTYSSGQKQRLSIARALLHHPRVLFLDEPTRSLDPTTTMHLHAFVEEELMRREGMTILLTTHRLDEAQRLCDRVAIMDGGRIRACGAPDELRASLGPTVIYELRVGGLPAEQGSSAPRLDSAPFGGQLTITALPEADSWLFTLETSAEEAALPTLIERVIQAGGQVQDVTRERPSLESVFQRFTTP
jgi:ABC-2 type transport system ATP-binding protein